MERVVAIFVCFFFFLVVVARILAFVFVVVYSFVCLFCKLRARFVRLLDGC